jgi:hypothetical protein
MSFNTVFVETDELPIFRGKSETMILYFLENNPAERRYNGLFTFFGSKKHKYFYRIAFRI